MIKLPPVARMFVVYVEGIGEIGTMEEFKPPALEVKTENDSLNVADGEIARDMGMAAMKWTAKFRDGSNIVLSFGLLNAAGTKIRCESALSGDSTTYTSDVHTIYGQITKFEQEAIKAGKQTTYTVEGTATYYQRVMGGIELCCIDQLEPCRRINGVDQLEGARRAVGL